jgi:hypothetical protein
MNNGILIALLMVMAGAIVLLAYIVITVVRRLVILSEAWIKSVDRVEQELLPALSELRDTLAQSTATIERVDNLAVEATDLVNRGKDLVEATHFGLEATKAVKDVGTSAIDYIVALRRGLQAIRSRTQSTKKQSLPSTEEE